MVTLGDEGFGIYGGNDTVYPVSDTNYPWTLGPGYNWTTNLGISTIDFGTYHMYPQSWGESDTTWAEYWIQWHATAAAAVGKPCIGEEYGSTTQADEADWLPYFIDTQTAGMMYWQYGDTISTGQTANDGYTIYYGTSLFTSLVSNAKEGVYCFRTQLTLNLGCRTCRFYARKSCLIKVTPVQIKESQRQLKRMPCQGEAATS
jgi:mannan endo-1,4-beta-mannosidase